MPLTAWLKTYRILLKWQFRSFFSTTKESTYNSQTLSASLRSGGCKLITSHSAALSSQRWHRTSRRCQGQRRNRRIIGRSDWDRHHHIPCNAHSPSKLAALYAIELLHNKDEKKALQLYEELQRRKDMFYLPGETAMALNVAEQIAKL